MGVVAGIHLAVFFFIARGLGIVPAFVEPPTIGTEFIDEPQEPEVRPRIDDPVLTESVIRVPLPDNPPVDDSRTETVTAQAEPDRLAPPDTGSALPQPLIEPVRQDTRHPLSQPPYPASQIRAGNEGNADVEVYVLPNGRVGDARIVRSTGYELLDQSALAEAKRNWRLTPATRDGVPFAQWYKVRVTFKITNR